MTPGSATPLTLLFYLNSMYVPKLTVILLFYSVFRVLMKNWGDTIPNLGGIGSACHDRPKSNNYVLYF